MQEDGKLPPQEIEYNYYREVNSEAKSQKKILGKECPKSCALLMYKIPYSSKFSRSKSSVIQPAQLLTDNNFRDSLLLQ